LFVPFVERQPMGQRRTWALVRTGEKERR